MPKNVLVPAGRELEGLPWTLPRSGALLPGSCLDTAPRLSEGAGLL